MVGVKINVDGLTVASEESLSSTGIITNAEGSVFKLIVKLPVSPDSEVVLSETETAIPAPASLSVLTTVTSSGSKPDPLLS